MLNSKDFARSRIPHAAVKKHLTILQEGNLISVETDGRSRVNTLDPDGLRLVTDFDTFWDGHRNTLKSEIEKDMQ